MLSSVKLSSRLARFSSSKFNLITSTKSKTQISSLLFGYPIRLRRAYSTAEPVLLDSQILSIAATSSPDIKLFKLKRPPEFSIRAGQAVDVHVLPTNEGLTFPPATFSLLSPPTLTHLEFAIKETHYPPIQWFFRTAKPGSSLLIREDPVGRMTFPSPEASRENLLLIGAGIGITPFLSIVQSIKEAKMLKLPIIFPKRIDFIHQASSLGHFLLWPRLVEIAKRDPTIHLNYCLTETSYSHKERISEIDENLLKVLHFGQLGDQFLKDLNFSENTTAMICGPNGFVSRIQSALETQTKIPKENILI